MKIILGISLVLLLANNSYALSADDICEKAFTQETDETFNACLKVINTASGSVQYSISRMYSLGLYPPFKRDSKGLISSLNSINQVEQKKYLFLAAENSQPSGIAAREIGDGYRFGSPDWGLARNYSKAIYFYKKSVLGDNVWGASSLATMYTEGLGEEKNIIYGYAWNNIALSMNPYKELAYVIREEMRTQESLMTTKQINEAQQISSQCIDSNFKKCLFYPSESIFRKIFQLFRGQN